MSFKDLFIRKCKEAVKEVEDAQEYLVKAEERVKTLREGNRYNILKDEIESLIDKFHHQCHMHGWLQSCGNQEEVKVNAKNIDELRKNISDTLLEYKDLK